MNKFISEVEVKKHVQSASTSKSVRGMVPRSRSIDVEHSDLDGERVTTTYEHGMARLIANEIDHLNGVLSLDRMRPGVEPIPVSQYRGSGAPWTY